MSEPVLRLDAVSVSFGGVRAVKSVNLNLQPGELIGLIGPNGAGKTTIFNLITGSVKPTEGAIHFKGKDIVGKSSDQLCHLGISRTFQNIRLFPQMSVFENVALGLHSEPHYSIFEAFVRTPRAQKMEKEVEWQVAELLGLVGLQDYTLHKAGILPYGLQRRLELARAMATSPELLLLDEPAAGMNEDECGELVNMIRHIHELKKYSIILIEHHMNVVMDLCRDSRILVLNLGEALAVGSPTEIQNNPQVIAAYLGAKESVMQTNIPFLDVANLNVHYGGIHALRDINLQIARGEIASVIGANGAGKSTLLKTISSVKSLTSGSIKFNGKELPKESFKVVKEGVTLVPEGRRIFGPLSVRENLMLGAYSRSDIPHITNRINEVFDLFPVLKERINQPGGTLSGGEQQMLAIGRALMSDPQLLLLDEPSLGLAPMIIDLVLDTIVKLNEETGLTILLVEQNATLALEISHHSFVLETGVIKMQGKGSDLLDDPRVKESYLGVAHA